MWSDPKDSTGISPNRQRGAGALFGPDVTAQSLEVKMKKYSTLTAEEVPPPEERTAILIRAVQDRMSELVCQHRVELVWYYDALDTTRTGKVTLQQWAQGMQFVLGLALPWRKNKIDVGSIDWGGDVIKKVNRKIYERCHDAEQAFAMFDADGDGRITCREFASTLLALDVGLNDRQIYEFMRSIDNDMDNNVSLPEFMDRFQVVFVSGGEVDDIGRRGLSSKSVKSSLR